MQQHFDFFLFICSLSTVPFVHCTFRSLRGFCSRSRRTGGFSCFEFFGSIFPKKTVEVPLRIVDRIY
uniref:Putative secreted protein n=1 Tax=Anopheles marajoara TaxID=58244 RepID=A0A2M4CFI0_9DIPT